MANMNLTRYESDDELEFFIDELTGKAYASQRATSRMWETSVSNVYAYKNRSGIETITAEVLTSQGLRTVQLFTSETVFEGALKYNKPLAIKMGAMGANAYICHQAGYQLKLESPVQESAKEVIETEYNPNPKSMFSSVFDAIIEGRKRGIEDAIVIKLMAGDRRISRETAEWLMETEAKGDQTTAVVKSDESDLTNALTRQPGTRRGRKAADCIRSEFPKVYLRYSANKWYAKYAKIDGTEGKVPGLFDTDVEAYRAQQRFLKQS